MFGRLVKFLLHIIIVRPILQLWNGLNVKYSSHWEKEWPPKGPVIIIANHNSHWDTLLIETLFPYAMVYQVRSVAAADYFFTNKALKWFALEVMRIIPVWRGTGKDGGDPLAGVHEVLNDGGIVIIYPEGKRGLPEEPSEIKKGITYLMQQHPDVPVIPIHMYGLGKAQGQIDRWWKFFPLPFIIDVHVDEPIGPQKKFTDLASPAAREEREILHTCVAKRFQKLREVNGRGAWM
jgi:1-acyl-sn-glycerol-3-phosphate acyltransferase